MTRNGSARFVAAVAAALLLAAVLTFGSAWDSSPSGDRTHATQMRASRSHTESRVAVDGALATIIIVAGAVVWTMVRVARMRTRTRAVPTVVRRRGPPRLLAY